MLLCYVLDHPENWDEYSEHLTHPCNLNVHQATGTHRLDLLL